MRPLKGPIRESKDESVRVDITGKVETLLSLERTPSAVAVQQHDEGIITIE